MPARTIWDASARGALVARLSRLSADSAARWGRFTATKMLAHVNDGMRMATGEVVCRPKRGPLRRWPLRHLILYVLPFPRGAPTAPELLERSPAAWDDEVAAFRTLLDRLVDRPRGAVWPEHPAFGRMTGDDWGALIHKHVDHHLRQFGA